jgi:hypothetical protein
MRMWEPSIAHSSSLTPLEASQHWIQLAEQLEATAKQTKLTDVRKWTRDGATSLRWMAEADRKREEERKARFE